MRNILFVAGLLLSASAIARDGKPAAAAASNTAVTPSPDRIAEGRKLIDLVLPPTRRESMLSSVVTSMIGNLNAGILRGSGLGEQLAESPRARKVFADFMTAQQRQALADVRTDSPSLMEAYARAYARLFTVEEMRQIEAFLVTPAGMKFATRASAMLSDPDVGAWQQRVAAREAERMEAQKAKFEVDLHDAFEADRMQRHAS